MSILHIDELVHWILFSFSSFFFFFLFTCKHTNTNTYLYTHIGWYPPPGQEWNYTNFTVMCGGPPPKENTDVCEHDWCLFNLKNDPCEYNNVILKFPIIVQKLKDRLKKLSKTTVLTWVNFSKKDIQR